MRDKLSDRQREREGGRRKREMRGCYGASLLSTHTTAYLQSGLFVGQRFFHCVSRCLRVGFPLSLPQPQLLPASPVRTTFSHSFIISPAGHRGSWFMPVFRGKIPGVTPASRLSRVATQNDTLSIAFHSWRFPFVQTHYSFTSSWYCMVQSDNTFVE